MTEEEWLACDDPDELLKALEGQASDRKLRLLGCACCRRVENLMEFPEFGRGVDVAEQFADGRASSQELSAAKKRAEFVFHEAKAPGEHYHPADNAAIQVSETWPAGGVTGIESARRVAEYAREARACDPAHLRLPSCPDFPLLPSPMSYGVVEEHIRAIEEYQAADEAERLRLRTLEGIAQIPLLRDIFGNPFRTVALDPAWLTSTVTAIASGMYESRDFGAMPILADALQDAGCDSDDILNHCRDEKGTHVRGCWVVDLILGKW